MPDGLTRTLRGGSMPFLLGILRFLLRLVLLVSALALAAIGVQGLGVVASRGPAFLLLGGSAVLLVVWRKTGARPALKGGRGKAVPATILRIWQDPPAGAPGVYWTYVLFDARGERVRVRLSKGQARSFLAKHSQGDIGRVAWKGAKLVAWQPATAEAPARTSGVSAFVSYERSWSKVEAGRLQPPPYMRDAAAEILDRAVYVDLRGRDPIRQLDDLAESLSAVR
jgi:hypothetical protein